LNINQVRFKMKPKKINELKEEIKKREKGCGNKKPYFKGMEGIQRYFTCSKKVLCHQCEPILIDLKATLKQT